MSLHSECAVGNFGERFQIDVRAAIDQAHGRRGSFSVDDQGFVAGALREKNSREDWNDCKGEKETDRMISVHEGPHAISTGVSGSGVWRQRTLYLDALFVGVSDTLC